jgi:hypothetical protein
MFTWEALAAEQPWTDLSVVVLIDWRDNPGLTCRVT